MSSPQRSGRNLRLGIPVIAETLATNSVGDLALLFARLLKKSANICHRPSLQKLKRETQ